VDVHLANGLMDHTTRLSCLVHKLLYFSLPLLLFVIVSISLVLQQSRPIKISYKSMI